MFPAPTTIAKTLTKLVRAKTICNLETLSLRYFGATKSTIAVEMLPMIVALATEVVVMAVKPKIVEMPN